jgi:hypothetical protein
MATAQQDPQASSVTGLPTREEQERWKPLEWERFKDERRRYWGRLKLPMLKKSCAGRNLYAEGNDSVLRDRLLKSDLDLGLTDFDRNGPPTDDIGEQPAPADGAASPEPAAAPAAVPRYEPMPGEICYSTDCQNEADPKKECPNCKKNGWRTFFCGDVSAIAAVPIIRIAMVINTVHLQACYKSCWATHKKLHKVSSSDLALVNSWGIARKMAGEVLCCTDLGSITAVASMANTDELVAIMALRKNDNDVGRAIMHLSGRDSDSRMEMPTQDEAMDRVLQKLRGD